MRGHRAQLNPGNGEVDENFWAQAAADQTAGRGAEDEGDEIKFFVSVTSGCLLTLCWQPTMVVPFHSIPNFSMMTTMTVLGLTMYTRVVQEWVHQTLTPANRIYWLQHRVRRVA